MILHGLSYCNEGFATDGIEIGTQDEVLMPHGLDLNQIRRDHVVPEEAVSFWVLLNQCR